MRRRVRGFAAALALTFAGCTAAMLSGSAVASAAPPIVIGGTIASAVTAKLRTIPLLGPVIGAVASSVQGTLTSMCGVTVTGVNAAAAPVQDGAKAVADASQQATGGLPSVPGTGGATGGG